MDIDCIFSVLQYLPENDIVNSLTMCKLINSLHNDYLWKLLYDDRCSKFYDKPCSINWYKTCKVYMSVTKGIDKKFFSIFENVNDVNEFKNIMYETNALISGSFIMQQILGEKYEDSDVDIFLSSRHKYAKKIDDFLYSRMELTGDINIARYREQNYSLITNVTDYEKNGHKIQLIYIDVFPDVILVHGFIEEDFDFDICKNVYYYNEKNSGKGKLVTERVDQILEKKTEFKISTKVGKTIQRYHKYKERGFVFTNFDNLSYKELELDLKVDEEGYSYKIIEITRIDEIINDKCAYTLNDPNSVKTSNWDNYRPISRHSFNKITFKYEPDECHDNCPIKFCDKSTEHYHYLRLEAHYVFIIN